MEEFREIREKLEKDGYVLTDQEFEKILKHAERKVEIIGKDEYSISLLLPSMVKEYFFSISTIALSILQAES